MCRSREKEPLNTSYVYQPEGEGSQDRKLVSVTYTLQCARCEHKYAICRSLEN
jgi:hypothetical protein